MYDIVNSTTLKPKGIPAGKRLITETEIRAIGKKGLINLDEITPLIRDQFGNTGSRKWYIYEKDDGTIAKISRDSFESIDCPKGIPKHTMAILETII